MAGQGGFSPFDGVQETLNGEIKVYEISASGLKIEITDLDRLEKVESGEFQIAEHKSSQKLSLLEPAALDEVMNLFFLEESTTGDLRLKPGVHRVSVYDAIESRLPPKERKKKKRGKLTKLDRARRKYVQSIVNKAKAISLAYQEETLGRPTIELDVNPEGKYSGQATESDANVLKSIIVMVRVVVLRSVDEDTNTAIAISQHSAKNMQLLIALAQTEIDQVYGDLGINLRFEREIK